jgi:hypothetical protein
MAVIEQQATGKIVGLQLVEHNGRGHSGMEPRLVGNQAEEFEAKGFAGLFFTGADVEIGRGWSGGKAVGVKGPKGQKVELIGGAREVLAKEGGHAAEQGATVVLNGGGLGVHGFS